MGTPSRKPSEMLPLERTAEGKGHIAAIWDGMANGAEFEGPSSSSFYADTREAFRLYGDRTRVSPRQLTWLRRMAKNMKGKRK